MLFDIYNFVMEKFFSWHKLRKRINFLRHNEIYLKSFHFIYLPMALPVASSAIPKKMEITQNRVSSVRKDGDYSKQSI